MAVEKEKSTPQKKGDPFAKAMSWESSRILLIQKTAQRDRVLMYTSWLISLMLAVGVAGMLPLKENTPYVIRVDNTTGVPDIVTALDVKGIGYDEVMDKYWMAQYVRSRETYDWYTIQKDYNTVGRLSSKLQGAEYAQSFEGENSVEKRFGKTIKTTVEVISVIPNGRGIGTVRFITTTKRLEDKGTGEVAKFVATIGYEYLNPSLIKESDRLVNPFGFQVNSYRRDPEM